MEIPAAHGYLEAPYSLQSQQYPSNLDCQWILYGGKTMNRGLTILFQTTDLDDDPRGTAKSEDHLKVEH